MAKKHKTYKISCGKCNEYLLTYHKFGAGKCILRLYLAHIASPPLFADLHTSNFSSIKEVPNLQCTNCQEVLGVATLGMKY